MINKSYSFIQYFKTLCIWLLMPVFLLLLPRFSLAQFEVPDQETVVKEGYKLYRSELATWNAADLFLEKFPEKNDDIGGYFSYSDGNNMKTVFFSKAASPTVLVTITQDSSIDFRTARIDSKERIFTRYETQFYMIRLATILSIQSDNNEFYKTYKNTSLNVVPLIDSNYKRVYVMTGMKQSCLVIFGNDYLLTFGDENRIISKRHLHQNIIPVECSREYTDNETTGAGTTHLHNVETGDLPTPTDICTILLYGKQASWKQHTIFSPEQVSIWNCEANQLTVMTKSAWRDKYHKPKKDLKLSNKP